MTENQPEDQPENGQMWTNKLTENLPTNVNFEQLKIQFEISNRISNS